MRVEWMKIGRQHTVNVAKWQDDIEMYSQQTLLEDFLLFLPWTHPIVDNWVHCAVWLKRKAELGFDQREMFCDINSYFPDTQNAQFDWKDKGSFTWLGNVL